MNKWIGIGNLTRDPELRYSSDSQMAVAKFTLAINDGYGEKKKTYFIPVTVFGKQAESCEKHLSKGKKCAVEGKIVTGSYTNKDGATVYTTDVVADRVEFLEWGEKTQEFGRAAIEPNDFAAVDEQIPF